jgi:hypothetical protein
MAGSRPFGSSLGSALPPAAVPTLEKTRPSVDMLRLRLLIVLSERFDAGTLRRMPASLVRETARRQLEQTLEAEAARMSRPDRQRMIEEVLGEAFGFGPLEELFGDPAVAEIVVLEPYAIVVRRGQDWQPTNVKFRDAEHLEEIIDKARSQGETVGGPLPESMLDVKLSNGFRAVGVVPVATLGLSPTIAFARIAEAAPAPATEAAAAADPASAAATTGQTPSALERHRERITELFLAKLAGMKAYDLSKIESSELLKILAAYVEEYCTTERIYLSEADKGRLSLEILTGMRR